MRNILRAFLAPVGLLLLSATGLSAQITLTQGDIGAVGSSYYMGVDTVIAPGYLGTGGANQTWDFTTLSVHEYDTVDFVDPASTASGSNFPMATLAVAQASAGEGYAYMRDDASGLEILGFAGDPFGLGQTFVLEQNPTSQLAVFPLTYQTAWMDTTAVDITVDASNFGIPLVDSVRYKSVQHRDLECDGFGDLMLFSGTFPSLRVRQEVETFDSIWARTFGIWTLFQDSTYTDSTFTWWGNGAGYLLTEATYIGGVLTEITYQDPNPVSVAPGLENELQVFPNPANQQIVVQNDVTLEATFSLMNIQGQTLRTQSLGQGRVEIAVDDLSNGLYMYQFRDDRGQMLKTGKLVIRH